MHGANPRNKHDDGHHAGSGTQQFNVVDYQHDDNTCSSPCAEYFRQFGRVVGRKRVELEQHVFEHHRHDFTRDGIFDDDDRIEEHHRNEEVARYI